jgi:hypothetical protein
MNYSYGTSFGYDQLGSNDILNEYNYPHTAVPDVLRSQFKASRKYQEQDSPEDSKDGGTPSMLRFQQRASDNAITRRMIPVENRVSSYEESPYFRNYMNHSLIEHRESEKKRKLNSSGEFKEAMEGSPQKNEGEMDQDCIFYFIIIVIIIVTMMLNIRYMKKLNKNLKYMKSKIKKLGSPEPKEPK